MESSDASTVLKILSEDPNIEQVAACLKTLSSRFTLYSIPNPQATRIYSTILTKTLPDFWDIISENATYFSTKEDVVNVFRSVAGIGALLSRLRQTNKETKKSSESVYHLSLLLDVLELVLQPETTSSLIWKSIIDSTSSSDVKRVLVWKEYTNMIASGVVTSTVAEAEDHFKTTKSIREGSWISKGPVFAEWLGRNDAVMAKELHGGGKADSKDWEALMHLVSKSLSFSYRGAYRTLHYLNVY